MKPKPAVRLNPLPKLKVKNPYVKQEPNPCLVSLTVLLNCWASNGEGSVACQPGETELKQCMDTYVSIARMILYIIYIF